MNVDKFFNIEFCSLLQERYSGLLVPTDFASIRKVYSEIDPPTGCLNLELSFEYGRREVCPFESKMLLQAIVGGEKEYMKRRIVTAPDWDGYIRGINTTEPSIFRKVQMTVTENDARKISDLCMDYLQIQGEDRVRLENWAAICPCGGRVLDTNR